MARKAAGTAGGKLRGALNKVAGTAGLRPEIFGAYKRMLAYQFVGTVGLVVFVVLGIVVCVYTQRNPPLLILIMLAGIMGAFFSALTRLYNVDQASAVLISPAVSHLGGLYLLMYSFVPMVVGAVASVVLYIAFVADVVAGGSLFPTITCRLADRCKDLQDLLSGFGPAEAKDYGKALLWAFAAGFAERLVPDTLGTLVAKQEKAEKK